MKDAAGNFLAQNDILHDSRKTVFLADRSESFLMYLRILLERMGFRVVPLKKGSLLRSLMQVIKPEMIILGATLEDTGAGALLGVLREDGWNIPAVMICNSDEDACAQERSGAENVHYLGRPVNIFRLYRVIFDVIRFTTGEKRVHLRTAFREKVIVRAGGETVEYWATTLSEGGVYVRTRHPLFAEEDVLVDIPLGFDAPTTLRGRFLYVKEGVSEGSRAEPGVAIQFVSVEPEQSAQLLVCILGLLVGDLLEEQDEPVLSLVSRTNELYEGIVLEHIRVGQELKRYQLQFKNMVEALPLGAVTFSLGAEGELTLVSVNPVARKLLGVAEGGAVGDIDCPFDWKGEDGWGKLREVATEGGTLEIRGVPCRKNGHDRLLDLFVFQPNQNRVSVILDDVSLRRRQEEEELRLQKLESLGLLAGGIAHDFNNLLQQISGNVALARVTLGSGDDADERARHLLDQAERGIGAAGNLTKQLLTFARGGNPIKEPMALAPLAAEATRFCLHGSSIRPEFDLDEDLWNVEGDRGQLHQVFANLVINAKQAMPQGGVVTVSGTNAEIPEGHPVLSPGRYVVVSVVDTGIGIPNKILSRVFDPYFSTKQEGSGLGLSSAYSVVKKHGGWIDASSVVGEGSRFDVYLPAYLGGTKPLSDAQAEPLWKGSGRVLLMDDEDHVRKVFQQMLETLGFAVASARDGQEMLDIFARERSSGRPFACVILDLTVRGGMGGAEALQRLKELDPDVKAFATSGYADSPVLATYQDFGFAGVLPKPVSFQTLSQTLQRSLQSPSP